MPILQMQISRYGFDRNDSKIVHSKVIDSFLLVYVMSGSQNAEATFRRRICKLVQKRANYVIVYNLLDMPGSVPRLQRTTHKSGN